MIHHLLLVSISCKLWRCVLLERHLLVLVRVVVIFVVHAILLEIVDVGDLDVESGVDEVALGQVDLLETPGLISIHHVASVGGALDDSSLYVLFLAGVHSATLVDGVDYGFLLVLMLLVVDVKLTVDIHILVSKFLIHPVHLEGLLFNHALALWCSIHHVIIRHAICVRHHSVVVLVAES